MQLHGRLINLCPHEVVVVAPSVPDVVDELLPDDIVVRLPSQGVARLTVSWENMGDFVVDDDRVPIERILNGAPEGLPPERDGVFLVVAATLGTATARSDLLGPGRSVRDRSGRVIACRSLVFFGDEDVTRRGGQ